MKAVLQIVVGLAIACACLAPTARADETRVYVRDIPDEATWEQYSRVLGSDRYGKFIIDIKSNDIYYIDVNVFKLHADFVLGVLLKQDWTRENVIEYNKNYEREKPRFILGYLTHHMKVGLYTWAHWEGDKIDADGLERVYKKLNESFFTKNLTFRPDSPMQEKVARTLHKRGVKTATNDQIYRAANYQAFNAGEAVGMLRVVSPGTRYESLVFDRNDIVLLQESYPDISPVAGILSTLPSTPLSHVNLRATAWGIPNASFKQAHERYRQLDGTLVYLLVSATEHVLRPATEEERVTFERRADKIRTVHIPAANLSNANLPMLTRIGAVDVTSFGAKTANLGEIASSGIPDVHVPQGFGVPFYYYVRHLRQHGLDDRLQAMLANPRWQSDMRWRKVQLEEFQKTIRTAPLDPEVMDAIYKRVRIKLGGKGVFVRSSTNAEDLPGFNGAGLYDTVPNVRGKQNIGDAVKQVWASLWNFRAVEERVLFGIDHTAVFPGVMIQIGVNPSAAGVLITANLYDPEDEDSFTINAKWGLGIRVVEGTKVPEQIIYNTSNDGTKIISRSDDPIMLVFDEAGGIREVPTSHAGVILTEARAKQLCKTVVRFRHLFGASAPLDVEWLFEDDMVWIVQARPYVTANRLK